MKKLIQYAERKGYKGHLKYMPLILPRMHIDPYKLLNGHESDIFFDHDFMVALFEEDWYQAIKDLAVMEPKHRKDHLKDCIRGRQDEQPEKA